MQPLPSENKHFPSPKSPNSSTQSSTHTHWYMGSWPVSFSNCFPSSLHLWHSPMFSVHQWFIFTAVENPILSYENTMLDLFNNVPVENYLSFCSEIIANLMCFMKRKFSVTKHVMHHIREGSNTAVMLNLSFLPKGVCAVSAHGRQMGITVRYQSELGRLLGLRSRSLWTGMGDFRQVTSLPRHWIHWLVNKENNFPPVMRNDITYLLTKPTSPDTGY